MIMLDKLEFPRQAKNWRWNKRKTVLLSAVITLIVLFAGCENAKTSVSFENENFENISRVVLYNCHNGKSSCIDNPQSISDICTFLRRVSGEAKESGKGYYEGTYTVELQSQAGMTQFEITFGDSDVFYYGKGDDGYKIRFRLVNQTAKDITEFLEVYDTSGFVW